MIDGPWEMSGPEEGDTIDQRVFVCHPDYDGYEVIEITKGTTTQRKQVARRIVRALNEWHGVMT